MANDLTVYTALEADLLPNYKKSFEEKNPGVNIRCVRDSTGIIAAKLLAEKDNPSRTRCSARRRPRFGASITRACSAFERKYDVWPSNR